MTGQKTYDEYPFIKKKHIRKALCLNSTYKTNKIFKEYSDLLANEKLTKIDPSSLPKTWFIEAYSCQSGVPVPELKVLIEKAIKELGR